MEFGKVHDVSQLDLTNWQLPVEDLLTERLKSLNFFSSYS